MLLRCECRPMVRSTPGCDLSALLWSFAEPQAAGTHLLGCLLGRFWEPAGPVRLTGLRSHRTGDLLSGQKAHLKQEALPLRMMVRCWVPF